jgi:hypothetical protein
MARIDVMHGATVIARYTDHFGREMPHLVEVGLSDGHYASIDGHTIEIRDEHDHVIVSQSKWDRSTNSIQEEILEVIRSNNLPINVVY